MSFYETVGKVCVAGGLLAGGLFGLVKGCDAYTARSERANSRITGTVLKEHHYTLDAGSRYMIQVKTCAGNELILDFFGSSGGALELLLSEGSRISFPRDCCFPHCFIEDESNIDKLYISRCAESVKILSPDKEVEKQ